MTDRKPIVTDEDLARYEAWATEDLRKSIGQQAAARRTLELLAEVRLARRLFRGLYFHIADLGREDELQAELERYAGELGIIKAAGPDLH